MGIDNIPESGVAITGIFFFADNFLVEVPTSVMSTLVEALSVSERRDGRATSVTRSKQSW